MYKILILEDDELFRESLEDFLEDEDFEVVCVSNGEEAFEICFEQKFDLYLFDINVPKVDGIETLKELRRSLDDTPTIYLTSYKDKDKLTQGFLSGCDDYLKKPIDLDELLLRVYSLLKRSGKSMKEIVLNEEYIFDPKNRRVLRDGKDINLAGKVVDLLELFLEKKGVIITKEMIIDKLWHYGEEYSEGSIRVYINNLKKLFGKDKIKNLKGVGYKLEL